MGDHVRVDPQGAANALGGWDDAAGKLQADFAAKAQAALAAYSAHIATVGDDHAGHEYKKAAKPEDVAELLGAAMFKDGAPVNGNAVTQAVVELGENTRTAINGSLASSVKQGVELTTPQQAL